MPFEAEPAGVVTAGLSKCALTDSVNCARSERRMCARRARFHSWNRSMGVNSRAELRRAAAELVRVFNLLEELQRILVHAVDAEIECVHVPGARRGITPCEA